ncbi:histidine kinase [Spirochaetia bacterium]|nr:histidine kinase [Spirochaetia bacterium]
MSKSSQKVRIFSALEVANICGVVNQTAINWIRSGHLKAFTTPGGQYRVYAEDLSAFLDKRGMRTSVDVLHVLIGNSGTDTVLVIDHDHHANELLKGWLKNNFPHYEVMQAFDGFEAGRKLTEVKPSYVFLNTELPGIDGHELAKKLRDDPSLGSPNVIAISGNDDAGQPKHIPAGVADASISRPLDFEQLMEIMKDLAKQDEAAVTA